LANIGDIVEGACSTLNAIPNLSSCRWGTLRTNKRIYSGGQVAELPLDEAALGETCAEEGSVDGDQNPGSFGENEGSAQNTEPKGNLEDGYETHGKIIVFLDEPSDGVLEGRGLVLGLRRWGCSCSRRNLLGWLQSWEEVCAEVCCNVKDRVNSEWEHS
jgi:hypothetical protein